ncbi:MAG: hypothetical protein IJU42_04650 [Erysipelotrichaceae bacterium]|nr:hypothetical protein [Erysipelotrichaceae bacterium]
MIIDQISITISYPEKTSDPLPLVLINDDQGSSEEIYALCSDRPFVLASLSGFDWDRDLSPWPAKAVFKGGDDFSGKADDYLEQILTKILPAIKEELSQKNISVSYTAIAGYSLAGLFALYSGIRCDAFSKIASISGSLWYPGFDEYLFEHSISKNVDCVYLSLGDLEARTRNELMSTVQIKTEAICDFLKDKTKAVFELNEGNHFRDPSLRTAKGIRYLLNDQ